MRHPKYSHSFEVVRRLPEGLEPLRALAYNFLWSWRHDTIRLFRQLDRKLWDETGHNPVELLNHIGDDRLSELCGDDLFVAQMTKCQKELDKYLSAETWFDREFPGERDKALYAYFCAEFGIHECLPIYSGGLGVLAGDHLKGASDLGLPLVGVGLLYARGYFRQSLSPDGWQQERYPQYDFFRMPLTLVRNGGREPLRVLVEMPDSDVICQIWKAQVGRVELYLLDSNVLENSPADQGVTDTLYGGNEEMRLKQEMILGIGGYRALMAMGKRPTVCHMNEGHSAFMALERLGQFAHENNCDLKTARQCLVAGNVFTTHTPVPAGFDIFPKTLLDKYVRAHVERIGLTFEEFLRMGRTYPGNADEPFNMAVFAMENSNRVNGVSKLHASVSREMFNPRWTDYPADEVPIESVTNGIHATSWISRHMAELLDRRLGPAWRAETDNAEVWQRVNQIPDHELWETRENMRGDFVRYARRKVLHQMRMSSAAPADMRSVADVLDPRILTVGFARRFATYKRATLLLQDKERLRALLFHPERPIQFVFAGKAHPRDDGGKSLIQELAHFIWEEGARSRMVFLEDYDIDVARHMVQGVDLWLNNPRRPMEASGTSGMKVVPNGGVNLSVLDGWWAEAYAPGTGWAIGSVGAEADHTYQDRVESRSIYHLLENEIAPLFYQRTGNGLPVGWLELIRSSMAAHAPEFSTHRMVRHYAVDYYRPSADAYESMTANALEEARGAIAWRDRIKKAWGDVRVVRIADDAEASNAVGADFSITAEVELGSLTPEDVSVQALVGNVGTNRELQDITVLELSFAGCEGSVARFEGRHTCRVPGNRGYTVRVVPRHSRVNVPSELPLIAWEQE